MGETVHTMNDQWRKKPGLRLAMSGAALKVYGCAAALFYTAGRAVIQNGMMHAGAYSSEQLLKAMETDTTLMMQSVWASMCQFIGALAVPVFAFLLVEGFRHTASFRRYLLTMAAFALISEVPYDLAMSGKVWDLGDQNALITYALCLVMLYGLQMFQGRDGIQYRIGQGCIVVAAVLWSMLLQSAFGLLTLVLAAVYYLLHERRGVGILVGCAVSVPYVTAPLSGFFLWCYNGKRGRLMARAWVKYLFYALYPAHLLVLWLVAGAVG